MLTASSFEKTLKLEDSEIPDSRSSSELFFTDMISPNRRVKFGDNKLKDAQIDQYATQSVGEPYELGIREE